MRSLSTELRAAVAQVLVKRFSFDGLTDEDFAFLGIVSTYGDSRDAGGPIGSEAILKALRDTPRERVGYIPDNRLGATGPDMKRADPPELRGPIGRTGPVGEPGIKGDIGDIGPKPEVLPTVAPDTTDQANLPLGTMDRGPEPQDAETLLTTAPEIDPTDPPPDYTKLETAKSRRLDTDA